MFPGSLSVVSIQFGIPSPSSSPSGKFPALSSISAIPSLSSSKSHPSATPSPSTSAASSNPGHWSKLSGTPSPSSSPYATVIVTVSVVHIADPEASLHTV